MNGVIAVLVPRALFLDSRLKADFDAGVFHPVGDAPLYGEDLGAPEVSPSVPVLVAAALTGSEAQSLLDRLLEDGSGVVIRRAVPLYGLALRANLPGDVVRILPWAPVTLGATGAVPQGPTGAVPQDFWQKVGWAETTLVNVLLKAGELLYRGLVALATIRGGAK